MLCSENSWSRYPGTFLHLPNLHGFILFIIIATPFIFILSTKLPIAVFLGYIPKCEGKPLLLMTQAQCMEIGLGGIQLELTWKPRP